VPVVGLWLAGAAIAGSTALVAGRQWIVFALAGAALLGLGIAVAQRRRWAEIVSFLGLLGQPIGVVGSAIELARGGGDKAGTLRELGVDPVAGVAVNLAYSIVATVVLALWIASWLRPPRSAR
jgi:hypothetical protein